MQIFPESVETAIDGETVSVLSIGLSSTVGSIGVDFDLQKEADGAWRIVGLDAI